MGIYDLLDDNRPFSDGSANNSATFSDDSGPQPLAQDPKPGNRRSGRGSSTAKTKVKVSASSGSGKAAIVQELTDELHMYAGVVALAWSTRDPLCAGVLNSQSQEIAASLAGLMARSDRLLDALHGSGLLADIVRVLVSMAPLLSTVRAHHITHEVGSDGQPTADLDQYAAYQPA